MTDLETATALINAKLKEVRAPIFARAGKRAVNFYAYYDDGIGKSGYSISKQAARNKLFAYGLYDLPDTPVVA